MTLSTSLFDYELPAEAIAQHPPAGRDQARLMVVERATRKVEHRFFYELPEILAQRGILATLLRNTARVIKARIRARLAGGQDFEMLMLRPGTQPGQWWCLGRPLRKLEVGGQVFLKDKAIARLVEKSESGEALFELTEAPLALAERAGVLPLPPYIARQPHDTWEKIDEERYQTVYAKEPVAAAAPTAGLHFTPAIIEKLEADGHRWADVTLHVGLGTFRPISSETVEAHKIHTERYTITQEAALALQEDNLENENKKENKNGSRKRFRLAVGTTSLRVMEDYARKGYPKEKEQEASIFVYPPQRIMAAEGLITNFHLPRSTLMCLVAAFLSPGDTQGIAWLKELYAQALSKGYRFYSYGDAMMIY